QAWPQRAAPAGCSRLDGLVPGPAQRPDQIRAVELAAYLGDVHVDGAGAARVLLPPDALEQEVTRDDDARVGHEVREQVELLRGQVDGLARDGDVVRFAVEDDVAEGDGSLAALLRL